MNKLNNTIPLSSQCRVSVESVSSQCRVSVESVSSQCRVSVESVSSQCRVSVETDDASNMDITRDVI